MKKTILVTNDDGFDSEGLNILVKALKKIAHVVVVAPAFEKSACGHSLTLTKPLKLKKVKKDFYKLEDGTPSDCVYIALRSLFKKKPDLVVSGINRGANLGEDITYSGTASACMEAVLQGVRAVAFSQVYKDVPKSIDYKLAKKVAKKLCKKILDTPFPLEERKFLNVNIPPMVAFKGYKVARAGKRDYGNEASKYKTPKGEKFYWIGLPSYKWFSSHEKDCDLSAINEGFVSITPVHLDMTSYDDLKRVQKWISLSG
ncbi:MAG: 5'/3'-nucleotidase SurE [Proteobacteria bacterium]|nr:MAG: 5'/3'-nucleotidase SurE [Pseudomonadota bacterium]